MALGSSEPLREMSTRNVLGVRDKGGLVLRADNLHMLSYTRLILQTDR